MLTQTTLVTLLTAAITLAGEMNGSVYGNRADERGLARMLVAAKAGWTS